MDRILLHDAGQIFESEPKLIELPKTGYGVFVGDTHGDLDATWNVLESYLGKKENTLVFLGDYVDRGGSSRGNIDLLLRKKVDNPERIYLLMGNHEAPDTLGYPFSFWEHLSSKEYKEYAGLFSKLPYAASGNGLLALHGAPPDVKSLEDINRIRRRGRKWDQMIWGDLCEGEFYQSPRRGRPLFGKDYFAKVMDDLHKEVLIRSHQPNAPEVMLNNRCLTIFTSSAYHHRRTIAIADLSKETVSVDNLDIQMV